MKTLLKFLMSNVHFLLTIYIEKCIISERGDKNWEEARTKVWERMKSNGEVAYCESKDFYYTI
ncbi:hypothetical protein ODZ84_05790 [Chryseobacterium fluminis]|uniref:hypothetical protein n=1 Tax=Chryseobacterium fluminis TaxID=2983606 RepID=UPI002254D763|nr:hypothetical protein [Chryseobacterium sp. MMS21-Ot14]UZT99079.1 hypothetical protein ODZ84_05790 [Chryseobacterium sp. MMS21-Ot14]